MRISKNDFSGGQYDEVEPYLIPDNACVEVKNYEITIEGSLQKRKKVETSELGFISNLPEGTARKPFYVWYPSNKPTGAVDDEVYIVYGVTDLGVGHLYLFYNDSEETPHYLNQEILAVIYNANSVIEGFAGSDRFLISDGVNKGHYIFIN